MLKTDRHALLHYSCVFLLVCFLSFRRNHTTSRNGSKLVLQIVRCLHSGNAESIALESHSDFKTLLQLALFLSTSLMFGTVLPEMHLSTAMKSLESALCETRHCEGHEHNLEEKVPHHPKQEELIASLIGRMIPQTSITASNCFDTHDIALHLRIKYNWRRNDDVQNVPSPGHIQNSFI